MAAVLEKAKELDIPKDIVERNIKRASEKGQEAFIEKVYEVGSDTINTFFILLPPWLSDGVISVKSSWYFVS